MCLDDGRECVVQPLISIIMPVYNQNRYIEGALDSVGAQRLEALELIVVNDGSDTPVDALVRAKVPGATIIRQPNAGPAAARNSGIAQAQGRFIAFLDADDLWTTTALLRLLKGFRDAPGAGVVQGNVRRFIVPDDATAFDGAQIGSPYQGFNVGALLLRREVLLNDGLFDANLRRSEDVDLFIRWSERRVARLVIPDVVLYYRKYEAHARRAAKAIGRRGVGADICGDWLALLHRSMARRRTNTATAAAGGGSSARADRSTPAVSVIMTVRNGMPHLPEAIAAIHRQTLLPREIVAIVGSSEDGTLEYLRSDLNIRVIEQSGVGLAAARNTALQAVKCPLAAFCDHDDVWHPAKLEKQVAVIRQFSMPAACIVNFEEFSESGPAMRSDLLSDVPTLAWTPSALLAHRNVYASIGPFDPALGHGCDTDWFRRLRQSDIPCGVAGPVLLRKRRHGANLSRDPDINRAAMFKMIRKARGELKHDF
jgi:glycosyltransferase involved in cell wall biosynthesis